MHRLTKVTNARGEVIRYDYNTLNELVGKTYSDGDGGQTDHPVQMGYNRMGPRIAMEDLTGESTYTYNARDQIVEAENLCSCGFLISNYQYTYNDAGFITRERAKESLFASDKDYGHQGGPKEACAHAECNPWMNQNPQWQTTDRTFTYDNNGELLECRESKGQFDKTTYTYEYDAVGNRTKAKKQRAFTYQRPDLTTYQYNADNQLVSADVCEGNLYEHYTFRYDANGNLTTECVGNQAKVSYQYDSENRLKAVYDRQKLLMAAAYDGDGNRTFQLNYNPEAVCGYGKGWGGDIFMPEHRVDEDGNPTAEGELFSYLCSETGRAYDLTEYVNDTNRRYTQVLSADVINSGAAESYSYAGNQRLSRNNIWTEARGVDHNETSYYLYDGRGSVTANTWQNGMVTSVYQYDPYGQVTLGSTEHTDFYGYNAESYNPNTGLEYLRARYYNAERGRFSQEDTYLGNLREPLTLNRYAYVGNSPVNYTDPTGYSREGHEIPSRDESKRSGRPDRAEDNRKANDILKELNAETKQRAKEGYKALDTFLKKNAGALIGGTATAAAVILTAPGSLPVLFVGGMAMSLGGIGLSLGGIAQSELTKARVREVLTNTVVEGRRLGEDGSVQ